MIYELMYTSVPKGLHPGSMGYCTVALTPNCPNIIREKLENLSSYRHVFSPFDAQAHHNPVCLQHVIIQVSGKTFSVLSSIADAGLDYSNRTNKFAHHVATPSNECPTGNPAWALQQPRFLDRKWEGEPRQLSISKKPSPGGTTPAIALAWKRKTGDAGWAGVLAEAFLKQPTVPQYVIFDLGDLLLPLFQEAIALLPKEKQWQVTFSTFYLGLSSDVQCLWRGVLRDSPEAQQAKARKQSIIDLANAGTAPDTPWTHFARTGESVKPEATKAARPSSTPYNLAPSPGTIPFVVDDEIPTIRPAAKGKPQAPARPQPVGRPMSNITFDEKRQMAEKDEDKPKGTKLPYLMAGGIFALLLVFGLVIALVMSLSDRTVQAQATEVVKHQVASAPGGEEKEKREPEKPEKEKKGAEEKKDNREAKKEVKPPTKTPIEEKMNGGQAQLSPKNDLATIVAEDKQAVVKDKPVKDTNGTNGSPFKEKDNPEPLIPVEYRQLIPQEGSAKLPLTLIPQAGQCNYIRLLGKNVNNIGMYEHTLEQKASKIIYEITHAVGRLQFRKRDFAGEIINVVEVVRQDEGLVLRRLGNDEVRPAEIEEIIKILYEHPLLCDMERGGKVLYCLYPNNHRIDPPPAKLELTITGHGTTLKLGNEIIALQTTYQFLPHINARLLYLGTESKSKMSDVALQAGNLDTMRIKTESGGDFDEATKLHRKFVKLTPTLRLENPQVAKFEATLRYEGPVPKEPQKSDDKESIKTANSELLREVNKNSPHTIILKDLKVIARFAVDDKCFHFILWQLTP